MTSISPAQPRPPPLGTHPALHRTFSKTAAQVSQAIQREDKQNVQDVAVDSIDNRPTKRRKTSTINIPTTTEHPTAVGGKYQTVPWSSVVRISAEAQAPPRTETTLPPLPNRPWGNVMTKDKVLQDIRPPVRIRKRIVVPNTPDSIEIPSDAPLYEQKKLADYFPWTGKHPEDVLNDTHVKSGFSDRPPNPPEKELNTAKTPLYNLFKHKSGLETLSAMYALVIEAKSKHVTFSSTSSFKGPPPRVTLTEAKRKSWISDLANPDVPLRRLSKTIPQGIRGLSLLEQCLQHNIPSTRAIWFTKCVGANEIRTLKRKGTTPTVSQGAEMKWLREWTSNVEQFIESVINQPPPQRTKEKLRYSMLLAARLYLENLVDRDHYLDWIIKSFSAANPSQWPLWLTMIQLHRLDLIAFRKKGKQVAETLIAKYNMVRSGSIENLQGLVGNFTAAIRSLIAAKPNCFLMPEKWTECQKALTMCLDIQSDNDRQILEHLQFINLRALGVTKQGGTTMASPLEQIVDTMDNFQMTQPITNLYNSLCSACPDPELLLQRCLSWSLSKYRTGTARIYLCARLFRKLRRQHLHMDKVLLEFIFDDRKIANLDAGALRHFVSELSRSRSFPLSKYMQWLSVRGLPLRDTTTIRESVIGLDLDSVTITIQEVPLTAQLLTELCLSHTEDHLVNLRNSLLNHGGFDPYVEIASQKNLIMAISAALKQPTNHIFIHRWSNYRLESLPWSMKSTISYWLRAEMVSLAKVSPTEMPGKPPLPGSNGLTTRRFQIVREILELMGDITILADVLRVASTSKQEDLLAAAVDTISVHSSTLSAIGALEPLQALYAQTYVMLRSIKSAMPLYVSALVGLCEQYPMKSTPVRALQQDFVRGDRGRAVTACSPFSDGVAESLQQAGANFHDDFEAILQTETNMSDQTLIQLFKVLIDRIEKMQHSSAASQELVVLCQLLARLKLCQRPQGELLMKKWIARLCANHPQQMSSRLLFSLVYTRCVSIESIAEVLYQLPQTAPLRLQFYLHVRKALLGDHEDGISVDLAYGFKVAVTKFAAHKPVELLDIIGTDESGRSSSTATRDGAVAAVLASPDLIKTLSKPAWLVVSAALSEKLRNLGAIDSPQAQAKALSHAADPLSIPYCSLRMRMLCQNTATKADEKIQDDIAAILGTTVADSTSSLSASPRTFQTLLRTTGPVISTKVRSGIEQSFFNALPRFLQTKGLSQPPLPTPEEIDVVARILQQVVLVSTDVSTPTQTHAISSLIEKLTIYMKLLGPSSSTGQQSATSSPVTTSAPVLPLGESMMPFLVASLDYLTLLLQMLCIKRSVFSSISSTISAPPPPPPPPPPPASSATMKASQQDQIKLIGLLITIGTHPIWTTMMTSLNDRIQQVKVNSTINFAFDVAATMVDDMTDESRTFCARILRDKIRDERVRWLLGSVNSFGSAQTREAGHGYQVVHENKGVLGEWKPKTWELLESGGNDDSCLGLGLFGARSN